MALKRAIFVQFLWRLTLNPYSFATFSLIASTYAFLYKPTNVREADANVEAWLMPLPARYDSPPLIMVPSVSRAPELSMPLLL